MPTAVSSVGGYPVLGGIDDLVDSARRSMVDQVIVALPCSAEQRILDLMKTLRSLPIDVRLCPDMIGFHLAGPHRVPCRRRADAQRLRKAACRLGLDRQGLRRPDACGRFILFLISPLLLLIATLDQAGQPRTRAVSGKSATASTTKSSRS